MSFNLRKVIDLYNQLLVDRAVFTWLSKGIGFGFGFGFTTPFGWLVYLLWFWFYDSQVKTALQQIENLAWYSKLSLASILCVMMTQTTAVKSLSFLQS